MLCFSLHAFSKDSSYSLRTIFLFYFQSLIYLYNLHIICMLWLRRLLNVNQHALIYLDIRIKVCLYPLLLIEGWRDVKVEGFVMIVVDTIFKYHGHSLLYSKHSDSHSFPRGSQLCSRRSD